MSCNERDIDEPAADNDMRSFTEHEAPPIAALFSSCRLTLAIIGFFMFLHLYAQRVGMSVAIVCMVNQTAVRVSDDVNVTSSNQTYPKIDQLRCQKYENNDTTSDSESQDGPFVWPKELQGHILGAFFYGYLVSQVPGGLLAERFGGKWVLTGFFGLSTVATLLTPIAARTSLGLLIALRVLCGVGSGGLYPAMHAMLGQWAPPLERSKLCGLTYAGSMMGNVVALPISGLLCRYGFDGGWAAVFYVIGISSAITILFWVMFTSDTPSSHSRISSRERHYIINSLKGQVSHRADQDVKVPWLKIFSSGPVWAIIIASFCADWGLYTFLTNIPTFYKEVLSFNIQSNGLYSALPFLGLWANVNLCPLLADKLRSNGLLSTVAVRKLFNAVGMVGSATALVGLSFMDCSQTALAVTMLTVAVTVGGFSFCGYFVNHMDIAPRYAGTLMGIANGLSASAGFIAPYVAAVLTEDQTRESWQVVFFIAAGIYVFGAVLFVILASGDLQPWAVLRTELEFQTVEVLPATDRSLVDNISSSSELKTLSADLTKVTDPILGNR